MKLYTVTYYVNGFRFKAWIEFGSKDKEAFDLLLRSIHHETIHTFEIKSIESTDYLKKPRLIYQKEDPCM